VTAIDE